MAEGRTLNLSFILHHAGRVSPWEAKDLFRCVEDYTQHVSQEEMLDLLTDLGYPRDQIIATLQTANRERQKLPPPVGAAGAFAAAIFGAETLTNAVITSYKIRRLVGRLQWVDYRISIIFSTDL